MTGLFFAKSIFSVSRLEINIDSSPDESINMNWIFSNVEVLETWSPSACWAGSNTSYFMIINTPIITKTPLIK